MWYFRHGLGWRLETPASALVFGSSWHEAMDEVWRLICWEKVKKKHDADIVDKALAKFEAKWEEDGGPQTIEDFEDKGYRGTPVRTVATAHEMLIGYVRQRRSVLTSPDFKLLDIERPFAVPVDPANPSLFYVGRLDKVTRVNGKIRIYEHKTTSMGSGSNGFQQRYIDSFSPNSQVDGYLFAGSLLYNEPVKSVYVDAALVHMNEHDTFRFIPIEKQWQQIDAWLWEAHHWIAQLEASKRAAARYIAGFDEEDDQPRGPKYLPAFPRNTNVCTDFSGCPYVNVCRVVADPSQSEVPPGFKQEFWSPFDVLKLESVFSKEQKK